MSLHPTWEAHPASLRFALAASHVADEVRDPAFGVIFSLQQVPAHQQIEAVFAAAVILANAVGLDPHDLVTRARRQVRDLEAVESAVSAISDYAKGELR